MTGPDEQARPIVIVRRRRMEEDGHHGGAWKIAFADFMTAMMALFLVLWLVNASDTDTRKAVASYFNPIKLVERERSRRGLEEPGERAENEPATGAAERTETEAERAAAAFRAAPDAVLAEREAEALAAGAAVVATTLASELRPDDPFALDLAAPPERAEPAAKETTGEPKLADAIREAIRAAVPGDPALAVAVVVEAREGGTVVSLADGPAFAMFDSGSAVPVGRAVVALRAIAAVLAKRPERLRIEGHTDSRPVRGTGDNWRLSTERAHAARVTLVYAGLPPERIGVVAGYAASRPVADRPAEAAENRRIEIVLETP